METWDVDQTLEPCSNNSNSTHEGFTLSKCQENASIGRKPQFQGLTRCCFDQDEAMVSVLDMKFDL